MRLFRVAAHLRELRATGQDARLVRLPQTLVASLKRLDDVAGLFLRQIAGELNDAASVGAVRKVPRRELVQGLRQPQGVLHFLNARRAHKVSGLAHLRDVQDLVSCQDVLAVDNELAHTGRRVTAHNHTRRVNRLQGDNVTRPATNNLHHRAV